jgi:hypothetical protein
MNNSSITLPFAFVGALTTAVAPQHSRPTKRTASLPMSTSQQTSDRQEFIDGYCKLFELHFGSRYMFQGAKDGNAVKRFLAYGFPVKEALEVVQDSFTRTGFPYDGTTTIASFVSMWPHLIAARAKRERPKPLSKFELRQKMDLIKMMLARHPHNPSSVRYDMFAKPEQDYNTLRKQLADIENQLVGL